MAVSAEIIYNKLGKGGEGILEDDDLIKELRQGSTKAFSSFIDKYTPYVSTVIFRIIGFRYEDCKELVSDVFWAVWSNRNKLRAGKEKAYIGEIARNKAFNFIRSKKEELPLNEEILFSGESPESYAESRALSAALKKALSQLSAPKKELILRHFYYGQKIVDAAKEMDINSSTARIWLKRAKEELGDILRKEGIEL